MALTLRFCFSTVRSMTTAPLAIFLWQNQDIPPSSFNFALENLIAEEREHAKSMGSETQRRQFVLGRFFLDSVLNEVLSYKRTQPLSVGEHGKPFCNDLPVNFSLTHTPGLVGLVLHRQVDCGIDSEMVSRGNISKALSRYEENVPADPQLQLKLWVLKEAYAKATGRGLSEELLQLRFDAELKNLIAKPKAAESVYFFYLLHSNCHFGVSILNPTEEVAPRLWTAVMDQELVVFRPETPRFQRI